MWQVFSTYKVEPESYYLTTNFSDENSYGDFLNELAVRSAYTFSAKPNTNDKIITISTCANNSYDERIVLHARLIKEQIR